MRILDIGEVSRQAGIPPSALRYYEEVGLISSVARKGLRRQYGVETILQLALISMGKSAGFSLAEISEIFGKEGGADLPRELIRQRASELDRQITRLTTLRKALRHVADCPASSRMECPKFRRLLRIALRQPANRD